MIELLCIAVLMALVPDLNWQPETRPNEPNFDVHMEHTHGE